MSGPELNAGWSDWPAPAKLNLFLHITGRREDGYHLLQTVFRLLDWGDRIGLRLREDGQVRRDGPSVAGVAAADDLAVRAALLLQKSANVAQGVDIRVEKAIPAGGGFGGGSSDAATVLVALNALWKTGLDVEALATLGLALGADVPVFVRGHNAWAEGVGERLTPLALPPAWYVLADPGVHVPTPALFADPHLTRDAPVAKIADFASGSLLGNAFEPVLRRREPAVEAVLAALSRIGRARLTGSGSGCFVEFASRAAAEQGLAALPEELRAWVAAGVERSPLLDVLERY
ncbi:4-(cytidine 5'-diphospho)-2-C-methyl-D-erythritol kinase [Stenotrophomonas sp.]|uniref:4-(cytidine 5'-diphospho)-2-C-methyl-D-erythritol kinase n=1 Tax=Stenotrophomonas sp. TaxID=69392 RepID=UPI002FC90DA0